MIITPQSVTALMRNYRQEFQGALAAATSDWDRVAMRVPSSTRGNTYGWLGQFPKFREWIGDRVIRDMKAQAYTLENKTFESTFGISRDDMEDDNLGIYSPVVQEMGRAAATFADEECVFPLFNLGFNQSCYDGQNFFDPEHPVYANVDGTGAATSVSNYDAGPDDASGNPTNPAWYLLDTSRAIRPFIYQDRRAPSFRTMNSMEDESVFTSNLFRFGADARGNGGFGLWQLAYASTQPLTAESFRAAYDAMRATQADGGRPLGIKATHLVCDTSLEAAADGIINVDRLANGAANINYHKVQVLATPWLN